MMTSDDPEPRALSSLQPEDRSVWSPAAQYLVDRAEQAGYLLVPHGKPPFGWDFSRDGELILACTSLPAIENRMVALGII